MNGLLVLSRFIDRTNTLVGKGVSWLILLSILISAVNAVFRKAFNMSSNAWLEAQWYLFSAVFLVAAGWTLLDNEHVKVDLLYGALSRRVQLWIEILGTIFFLFPLCFITVYLSMPILMSKLVSGEVSNNPGGLLLWPVWAMVPLGFALLGAQAISELIKRIAVLSGKMDDFLTQDSDSTTPAL